METYYGIVRSPADAIKLFEACRVGLLPRVQRRLSEKERQSIRPGSVFVWDEREAGMRRWTDGKSWSASRVSGSFLTYREMEGKRGGGGPALGGGRRGAGRTPDSSRGSDEDHDSGEVDGYRYKVDGLTKQSFSIATSDDHHLHLISYHSRAPQDHHNLPLPTTDPNLRHIVPMKGLYPESSMNETPVPALARTPMRVAPQPPRPHPASSAPSYMPQQAASYQQQPPPPHHAYPQQPHHAYSPHQHHQHHQQQQPPPPPQGYPPQYPQNGYSWPPSPVVTPPYSSGSYAASSGPPPQTQLPPITQHPLPGYPSPQQQTYHNAPPNPQYDRAPLPLPQPSSALHPKPGLSMAPQGYPHQPRVTPLDSPGSRSAYDDSRLGGVGPRTLPGPLPLPGQSSPSANYIVTPPPRGVSGSPARSSHAESNATNGASSNIKKASLSDLIHHPTPANSEPGSAGTGSANYGNNSANGSPRSSAGGLSNGLAALGQPQQMRADSDANAVKSLNKNFCG